MTTKKNGFKFADRGHELTIDGKPYKATLNQKTIEMIPAMLEESQALADQIKQRTKNAADLIEFDRSCVDKLLGNGSFDAIFAERDIDALDASDVLGYIINEVTAAYVKLKKQLQAATPATQ